MQNVNSIQNAIINTNAGIQAVMVVDSANAHRVYLPKRPCDTKPVSKCSRQMSTFLRGRMLDDMPTLLSGEELGRMTTGPITGKWRHDRHVQVPAMVWATFVLSHVSRS